MDGRSSLLGQRVAGLPEPVRRAGRGVVARPAAGWLGPVVYVIDDDAGQAVLVEAWVAAEHLTPAGG